MTEPGGPVGGGQFAIGSCRAAEHQRRHLIYDKEHLLIDGPGKRHGYNFYRHAGVEIGGKDKGEAIGEKPPVNVKDLLP